MLYKALNNLSPYANTFKPAVATSFVHNSNIVFLSQQYQKNNQINASPYRHHHQLNVFITKNTNVNQSHYKKSNKRRHQKKKHRYSHYLQQQKNYYYNSNGPIHHYNPNINYQVSHEILQSLHASSNGVKTIPEWEHCWLQNGYILPPPTANNDISMLAPDKSIYSHYFWQLIHQQQQKKQYFQKQVPPRITPAPVMAPSIYSLLLLPPPSPPPHTVPLSPNMHYPPLSSPLNMTVSQQQQQFDFVPRFYQLPQCSSRSISIINPNTREQVTTDPIIVKPVPVAIKIKKPPVIEKEQQATIIELKNMNDDKKSHVPASTNTTTSISAATTLIKKKEQIQRQTCTTMIGVNRSVNNEDKMGEPIVENIMNNEQQQSTAITIVHPSSNNEDDVSNTMNNSNNINTLTITKETTKLIEPDGTSSDETEEECSDEYDDNVTIASTVSTSDNKEQFDNNEVSETKQRIQYSREFLLQLRYPSTQEPINDLLAIQPATLPVLAPMNTSTAKRKSNSSFIFNKGYVKNNYSVDTTTQQQPALFTSNIHNKKNNHSPWCYNYNNNEQNNKSFQQDKTKSRTTSLPKSSKQWIPSHELREKPLQHEKNTQNKNTVKNQYVLSKPSNRWIPPSKLHEKRLVEQDMNLEKRFTTTFANEVLSKSTHRWVPSREMRENDNQGITKQQEEEKDKVEQVEKQKVELLSTKDIEPKIKGLLNKLSPVNFDSISEQIWNYAKGSPDHLKTVVRMLFDKACDESHFATQWAKLCKKIQDILSTSASIDTLIQDDTIKDKQGHSASGVYLYRCYLLNRCQEQFEMEGGWWSNNHSQQVSLKDVKMLSDEYYIAMKQKRQGLGLVVFIGELYKQEMLTSKTVSHCLTKLLEDKEYVGDEEVETVCKLLLTIGESFDQVIQTKFWMNHYLRDMENMIRTNKKLSTRVKFKVMDVVDLRKNQWIVKEKKVKF